MSNFIYTGKGYVNLNQVQFVEHGKGSRHKLVVDGKVIDDNNASFESTVTTIVPVQGDWTCFYPCKIEDKKYEPLAFPVLAWGLTVTGTLMPITPYDMNDTSTGAGFYALKKGENLEVYDQAGQIHKSMSDWLQEVAAQDRPHEAA